MEPTRETMAAATGPPAALAAGGEPPRISKRALAWEFLKIGAIGHDLGPLLAFIESEFVDKRKVLTLDDVNEALTYTKPLPGSTVLQLPAYLGYRLHGWPGSALATSAYLLPSIVMMALLGLGYVAVTALPGVRPVVNGITAAVVGILLATAYRLSKRNVSRKDPLTLVLLVASFAAGAFLGLNVALITLAAGLVGMLFLAPPRAAQSPAEEAAR